MILLYLLCLVGLFLYFYSSKEGFYVGGQYDYLKPHDPAVLDEKTNSDFIGAFWKNVSAIDPTLAKNSVKDIKNYATVEEIKFYIQNNQWPYNSYLMNYITTNKDTILNILVKQNIKINSLDDLQKVIPARTLYAIFIMGVESKQSPVPLSYDIFTGKKPPPTAPAEPAEPEPSKAKDGPDEPAPSLSSDNYDKLKSICSSI
jgi:hypothetical protein